MFRRKDTSGPDPLPQGLRGDLATAGEKLTYRARILLAPLGKDAETVQRDFLSECRLSVLAFLNRKEHLSNLDRYAYGVAFPSADLNADLRTLLPRAGMRSLTGPFVALRQRGLARPGANLSENEVALLEPLWAIIGHISILPGNGNGRAYVIGEQGRLKTMLRERFPGSDDQSATPSASTTSIREPSAFSTSVREPSAFEPSAREPSAPASGRSGRSDAVPAPGVPASPDPAPDDEIDTELAIRGIAEIYASFPWNDALQPGGGVPDGRLLLPAPLVPLLEQGATAYRASWAMIEQIAISYGLDRELDVARRYQLLLLSAFLGSGLGVTLRDVRLLARVLGSSARLPTRDAWQGLGRRLSATAPLAIVPEFMPAALQHSLHRAGREVAEDFLTATVEGAVALMDVLLATGTDDDGSRDAYRRQVVRTHLRRAEEFQSEPRRRALSALGTEPSLPRDTFGTALGDRLAKLREALNPPVHGEDRREAIRDDFARHFLILFATAARHPEHPRFLHHTVAVLDRTSGVVRSAAEWADWHDETLPAYGLDPYVIQPAYLVELLNAARRNPAWRTSLDTMLGTLESFVLAYVEDVRGGVALDDVRRNFGRLREGVLDHLGPVPAAPADAPGELVPLPSTSRAEPDPGELTLDARPAAPASLPAPEPAPPLPEAPPTDTPPVGRVPADDFDDPFLDDFPRRREPAAPVEPHPVADAPSPPPTPSMDEGLVVLQELSGLIGLTEVKQTLQRTANLARVRDLRRRSGLPAPELSPHAAFAGSPGTGRRLVAGLLGRLHAAYGLLTHGQVTEVDAPDLLALDVPATRERVQEFVRRARGGVLFVDRPSELGRTGAVGTAAAGALTEAVTAGGFALVLADEPDRLSIFLGGHPELQRAVARPIPFARPQPRELALILTRYAEQHGYVLSAEAQAAVEMALRPRAGADREGPTTHDALDLFAHAQVRQADRLATQHDILPEDLMRLEPDDLVADLQT